MKKIFEEIKKRAEVVKHTLSREADALGYDPRLVFKYEPNSLVGEQYQMIRTNISLALANEENLKTILITSSMATEGKSVTSANLSLAFSKDREKKTILIDADMRRPSLHKLFFAERQPGLSDILMGKAKLEDCVQKPIKEELNFIPVGLYTEDPRGLIDSIQMKNLMQTLRESYDYIIIDTPPILSVSDSLILASMVDLSVLIIRANLTQEKQIKDALRSLKEANANIIGTVLTGFVEYSSYYSQAYKNKYRYYRRQ